MTSSIIGVVFDSVVNNLDISVLKAARKTNIMAITNALKAIVSLEYFLALSIFPQPRKQPVKAEAAKDVPRGIINMKAAILLRTTSAARASTLISPEKIANSSKHHHSKHIRQAPGRPILIYSHMFSKTRLSGIIWCVFLSEVLQQQIRSIKSILSMYVMLVAIAAPTSRPPANEMNKQHQTMCKTRVTSYTQRGIFISNCADMNFLVASNIDCAQIPGIKMQQYLLAISEMSASQ